MAATQADLDALDRMIASGVLSTAYDGKRIEYRSLDELQRARAALAAQIVGASGANPARNHTPTFSKGV